MCQFRKLLLVIIFVQVTIFSEQSSRVMQLESPMVVDYKYTIGTINPQNKNWWKRGTRPFDNKKQIILP
ncbi:hypothetical protein RN001_007640 [Aquatica leii]|uniref:Uncharacterized protein n=1 Tax=Aquatica leii TaxID=1421715 RepID=A0AAN7SGX0_9COLE|nr:hypothetical protein RN001_007640 [Aquatica leii]